MAVFGLTLVIIGMVAIDLLAPTIDGLVAQFVAALGVSRGDYAAALSTSLRTTIALITAALVFAVIDLVRRRTSGDPASPYLPYARTEQP